MACDIRIITLVTLGTCCLFGLQSRSHSIRAYVGVATVLTFFVRLPLPVLGTCTTKNAIHVQNQQVEYKIKDEKENNNMVFIF